MQEPSSVTTQHNTTAKGGDGGGLRLRLRLRDGQRGAAAAGRKTGEGEAAQAQKASDGWNVDEEARGRSGAGEEGGAEVNCGRVLRVPPLIQSARAARHRPIRHPSRRAAAMQ